MADIQLVEYLKKNIATGYEKYDLCNVCVAAGYSASEVKDALEEVTHSAMPLPPKPYPEIPAPLPPPPIKKAQPVQATIHGIIAAVVFLLLVSILWYMLLLKDIPIAAEKSAGSVQLPAEPQQPTLPAASCNECEYPDESTCKKAACCNDADCEDNVTTTSDVCESPKTKDARCVRSTVQCGNGNCEKGEACCLDCGCSTGYVCVENKCIMQKPPSLSILSPNEGDNISSAFNIELELKDAKDMHIRFVIDKGPMQETNETRIPMNLSQGNHEINISLVDNTGVEMLQKTLRVNVLPTQPVPVLTVSSPKVDDEIKDDSVSVEFKVDGVTISEKGFHIHFTLDGKIIEHKTAVPYMFRNVVAGKHTLEAALVDGEERMLTNPESFKTIPFVIVAAASPQTPPSPPTNAPSSPSEVNVLPPPVPGK